MNLKNMAVGQTFTSAIVLDRDKLKKLKKEVNSSDYAAKATKLIAKKQKEFDKKGDIGKATKVKELSKGPASGPDIRAYYEVKNKKVQIRVTINMNAQSRSTKIFK